MQLEDVDENDVAYSTLAQVLVKAIKLLLLPSAAFGSREIER